MCTLSGGNTGRALQRVLPMFSKIALAGVNKNLDPEKAAFRISKPVSWSWPNMAGPFLPLLLVHLVALAVCWTRQRNLRLLLLVLISYGLFGPVAISFAQIGFSAPTNFAVGNGPESVAVGDFNGDGKRDLAVANIYDGNVSILVGNGDGTFGAATDFAVGVHPISLTIGDFNGDGKQDLAVVNFWGSDVSILLGNGDGSFGTATNFVVGSGPHSVAVADFNGDGKPDLAVANSSSLDVSLLLGNGDGSFSAATNLNVGFSQFSLAVGDFNGDGKPDLAVANFNDNKVSLLLGNGDGSFNTAADAATGVHPLSLIVGDFNGDGSQDLTTVNFNGDDVSILLGNGDGSFSTATNFAVGSFPRAVAVGDFNRDGKQDLAVANGNDANVSILLGNGDGNFGAATNFSAGSYPRSVAVGDFNEDTKQDLAVTVQMPAGYVAILFNVPAISIGDVAVSEGDAGTVNASFQVSLSETSPQIITVDFSVANVTATGGSDYVVASGTVTFNPGETVKTITIAVSGDTLNEVNETFLVNLTNAANAAVVDGQAMGTITNDDPVTTRISITDVTVIEGNAGTASAGFAVKLSAPSGQVITVNYSTADGGATTGMDYFGASGTLIFNPGETTKNLMVSVIGDTVFEPNETFVVNLSGATNATIEDSQGIGTIVDDEIQVQTAPYFPIVSGDSWSYQGDGGSFTRTVLSGTVTINSVATKALKDDNGFVQYFTNDSAGIRLHRQFLPNTDIGLGYPVNLQLTFNPPIVLANATMAVGQNVTTNGTARTNKLPQVGVIELAYSASFTVEGFEIVTVPFGSFDTLKLQGSVNVGGEVVGETLYLVENIGPVKLVDTSGGVSETAELVATNNYTLPVVSVAAPSPTAGEPGGSGIFTISRNGATTQSLTIFYTIAGTATMGTDYKALAGSVTIPIGAMSANVAIDPIDDILPEANETVVLTISTSSSYLIGTQNSASVTIVDNDAMNPVAHVDCATTSLQSVIDLAEAGSTILVNGTCGANILVRNETERITFDGGGSAVIVGADPSTPALVIRGKGVLIQNFIIRGGSDGIHVNRGSNAVINNNLIENTNGNGVLVDELAFAAITYNTIQNNPGAGVFISENSTARIGFNSDNETAASPNAIQNNGVGVWVSNGSSARIVGNDIVFNGGDGIVVSRDSHADIASNAIDGNGGDGIRVSENSVIQLGEDSGTSILESPNTTTAASSGFGIRCTGGGLADGRRGTLTGLSGAGSFAGDCTDSLIP